MSVNLPADPLVFAGAALLVAGVLAAGFADRLRVPGLLLFLALGMLIGDDGLGLISLDDPGLAQLGGVLALVLILFEGGLATKPGDVRRAAAPGLLLATVGVLVTAGVTAGGVLLLLDAEPTTALLVGAVVASTDAAAVFTVLRRAPLPRRLTALLEVESGTNDPLAIMLTVGILASVAQVLGPLDWLVFGSWQLGGGLLLGAGVGWAGSEILRRADLGTAGLYPVLALGVAGLAYGITALLGASGFLAVYVTGLLVGARVPRHRRAIRTFHEGLANTAEIALFLLLGLLVFPSRLPAVALSALAVTAILVVLARPLAVLVCLLWFRFRWQELALVSWAGLRGAVPIVLATFPLTARYEEGETIFNVVFFVVLVSTALQGSTIGWLAGRLGLREGASVWAPVAEALPLDGMDADLIEVDVTDQLHIAGKRLREVPLPPGALLTTVLRNDRVLVPTGDTRLEPGDLALVAVPRGPRRTEEIVAWARGELEPPAEPI